MNRTVSIKASILICTYNRANLLQKTLEVLHEYYSHREDIEVLVIDNNSKDNTPTIVAQFPFIKYYPEIRQGLSYARNTGIEKSQGDIIIFLDDDAYPLSSTWADNYINFLTINQECMAAGGEVIPHFEIKPPEWIFSDSFFTNSLSILTFKETRKITTKEWLVGANLAYRKILFEVIGNFNPNLGRSKENLMSNDEIDIQKRSEEKHFSFCYLKGSEVSHFIHKDRLTKRWFKKRKFWQGRSNRILNPNTPIPLRRTIRALIMFINPFASFKDKTDIHYILGHYF